MITNISSAANRLVKEAKQLKNKSNRMESGLYIAEGENIVKEAVLHSRSNVKSIPDYIMEAISDTKSPQGVLAVMKIAENNPDFSIITLAVYLDNLSDPGNIGAIIRTADAAGIKLVILSPECADVYSPKIIRATMGSCFHVDIIREKRYLEELRKLQEDDFKLFAGSLQANKSHFEADLKQRCVICLGNEAHGLSCELMSLKSIIPVKIPILGKAESLNVSVAGAVLMYEALRQRGGINE